MRATRDIGPEVAGWTAAQWPGTEPMMGRYARLDRLDADQHASHLHAQFAGHDALWDYMPYGPFTSASAYHRWVLGDFRGGLCPSCGGRRLPEDHP